MYEQMYVRTDVCMNACMRRPPHRENSGYHTLCMGLGRLYRVIVNMEEAINMDNYFTNALQTYINF